MAMGARPMPKYSAKQRKMRGIVGKSKRQFLQLYSNVKRSSAYHSLNHYARCLLFELIDRYTGSNNGMMALGCARHVTSLDAAPAPSAMPCVSLMMLGSPAQRRSEHGAANKPPSGA